MKIHLDYEINIEQLCYILLFGYIILSYIINPFVIKYDFKIYTTQIDNVDRMIAFLTWLLSPFTFFLRIIYSAVLLIGGFILR